MGWLASIAEDPIGPVALVLAIALIVDMLMFARVKPPADFTPLDLSLSVESRDAGRAHRSAARAVRDLDLKKVSQAVEDTIIDRQHLTRILGTRALDLWIDVQLDDHPKTPSLVTRAKIAAFEPVDLTEDRLAQCSRMIKRRVVEEVTEMIGYNAESFVDGGVTVETAIERPA